MARSSLCVIPLCFVLSVAWADHRIFLTAEEERRWNTPPELIPEQVIREPDEKVGRLLTIPITANINVNTGNNAHSLGFQTGPQAISYSESNSFNYPGLSQSQSVSFAAGSTGISGSLSQASSVNQHHPNHGNVNIQGIDFSSAATSSSSSVQNGHATSAASSSAASVQPSISIGTTGHSQGTTIRFPEPSHNRQPIWTNINPLNHNNGQNPSRLPKLDIDVKPYRTQNRRPLVLQISSSQGRWENRQPTVHIHKWHPTYRSYYDNIE